MKAFITLLYLKKESIYTPFKPHATFPIKKAICDFLNKGGDTL